jgi:hypothetical protein
MSAPDAVSAPLSSSTRRIGATLAALVVWALAYSQLRPLSDWLVGRLPIDPASKLGQPTAFFLYDTPKALLPLTLVVLGMGVARGSSSEEI